MSTLNPSPGSYAIAIPRARFTAFLALVAAVLLINHIMLQFFYYQWDAGHWLLRDMFDVDQEENLPTYFSSFALLVCGGLLFAIGLEKAAERGPFARHWFGLSVAFLGLSVDEVAGIHEAINTAIDISWTVPAAIVVAIVGLMYVKFVLHLPPATRRGIVLAGILFVGGAVAVEHVTDWYLVDQTMDGLGYNLLTALEEGLEMSGIILLIHTLLGYMANNSGTAVVQVNADQ